MKNKLEQVFRLRFPHDTVDISDGYQSNLHVLIVSRQFDNLTATQRQDLLWDILDESSLTREEKQALSLLMPVSPSELK